MENISSKTFFWLVHFTGKIRVMFTCGDAPSGIYFWSEVETKNSKTTYEVLMLWNRFESPQEVASIDTWENLIWFK